MTPVRERDRHVYQQLLVWLTTLRTSRPGQHAHNVLADICADASRSVVAFPTLPTFIHSRRISLIVETRTIRSEPTPYYRS
jgi:hypothetical protein